MMYDFSTFKEQLKPNADKLRQALDLIPDTRRSVRVRHLVVAMGSFALAVVALFTPGTARMTPLAHAVQEEERAALTVIAQQEAREQIGADIEQADALLAELSQL